MGGSKNQSPAQKQKSQEKGKDKPGTKKGKKSDKQEGGSPKAEITVILTDDQVKKAFKNAKVITVQELARQTGVKISTANSYLRESVKKGTIKRVGGFSGHHIYQPLSA